MGSIMAGYFVLAIVLLLSGLIFKVSLLCYLAYLCVGLYALGRWYAPHALERVVASRTVNSHAFLGDEVAITISLTNLGRLSLPWLSVWDSVPLELSRDQTTMQVLSVPARRRASMGYVIKPRRRGYYRLGPMYLASSDLFGLSPQVQSQRPVSHITVYPKVTPLKSLGLPSRLPFGSLVSRQQLFSDPTRPIGIREYRAGDSQRHIHWKNTGHLGRLVVKTFEPAVSLETAILLNLHRGDYQSSSWRDHAEFGIEVAASLAAHLIESKQPVGFYCNGLDPLGTSSTMSFDPSSGRLEAQDKQHSEQFTAIAPRTGKAQLMRVLESLARVQATDSVEFSQWAARASTGLSWGVTVLAVTPTCDEATCNAMHRLVRSGFNPILIVTEPVYFAPVRARARRLGFRVYRTVDRRDLDEWRE